MPLVGFNGRFPFRVGNQIASLGTTTTFTPTLINEFRFSVSRQNDQALPVPNSLQDTSGTLQHLQGLNIPVSPPLQPVPSFSVGSTSWGPPSNNFLQPTNAFTLLDNVTKVLSRHTIKAGFMYRDDQVGTVSPAYTFLNFGGSLTSNAATGEGGTAFAQFLLGAVDQGSALNNNFPAFAATHTWGFYAQDDFRITPSLTLNLGLRYDIYGWHDERHCNDSVFDFNALNPVVTGRKGRIAYFCTPAHPDSHVFPPNHGDFGPRLNFAWSPLADRKTVVRGGIDLIYTNGQTQLNGPTAGWGDPGFGVYKAWITDVTGQGLVNTSAVPAFLLSQGAPPLPPNINPKSLDEQFLGLKGGGGFNTAIKNSRDPNVTVWNLQIQRELPGNFAIAAGYVGSKGTDLIGQVNRSYDYVPTNIELQFRSKLNQLVALPPDLTPLFGGGPYFMSQLFLPYPQYQNIWDYLSVDNSSVYHAFQLKIEKKYSHGLNFLAAYTAQKTIGSGDLGGFVSNTWTGGPSFGASRGRSGRLHAYGVSWFGAAIQNPDNRRGDRSLQPDDIPQIFNMAWTYELPFGPGKAFTSHATGIQGLVTEGWKISGNLNIQPGVPLTVNGPCNNLTCRANLIGDPSAGRGSKTRYQQQQQWFNPNAFEAVFGSDPAIIKLATSGTPDQKDLHDEFWRFGTAGLRLGNARSPGFWGTDLALAKDFRISEARFLQFRLDAYNAFNHQNLGLPNTGWCLPPNADGSTDPVHQFGCQFGRITGVQTDPRALQFALKFVF